MTIPMEPSIRQLEYFVTIAEERHFTRAAERLHVAQPSVSSQLRRLEQMFGTPLFHRDRGPVTLTDAGEALLPLARRVLADLAEVIHGAAEIEGLSRGHVAIGATPSLAAVFLPIVLSRFHRQYPGVSLSVTERDSLYLVEGLESGTLDLALAIMPLAHPLIRRVVLAVEELVVVTAVDGVLSKRRQVALSDLRNVPMIMFREGYDLRSTTLAAFNEVGFAPSIVVEGGEMNSVLSMVAAGLGVAIVPEIVATGVARLHVVRLHSPRLEREIGLVRRQDHAPSRAAAALSAEISAFVGQRGWQSQPHQAEDPFLADSI